LGTQIPPRTPLYDPTALTRQATVSLVGSLDGDYRYSNLKSIKVPIVVLQGTDDPLIPVESGQDLAANIQGADLFIIPGLGHDMPMQLVCQASLTQSSWQLLAHSQSTLGMILNCIQNLETLLNANFVRKNLANKLAK
jgi:fermentation-respiration switch protein FrsA (DUF1100 family)